MSLAADPALRATSLPNSSAASAASCSPRFASSAFSAALVPILSNSRPVSRIESPTFSPASLIAFIPAVTFWLSDRASWSSSDNIPALLAASLPIRAPASSAAINPALMSSIRSMTSPICVTESCRPNFTPIVRFLLSSNYPFRNIKKGLLPSILSVPPCSESMPPLLRSIPQGPCSPIQNMLLSRN